MYNQPKPKNEYHIKSYYNDQYGLLMMIKDKFGNYVT